MIGHGILIGHINQTRSNVPVMMLGNYDHHVGYYYVFTSKAGNHQQKDDNQNVHCQVAKSLIKLIIRRKVGLKLSLEELCLPHLQFWK